MSADNVAVSNFTPLPPSATTTESPPTDSPPDVIPHHKLACHPPALMHVSLLSSHYTLDVRLPQKIRSYMVDVVVHGRDVMGRERLKVLAQDWFEQEESK
jgi:hypothetical protein